MKNQEEIAVRELVLFLKKLFFFLRQKALWLLSAGLVAGLIGFFYASSQKPLYTAELTFTTENESGGDLSNYAGLAAQFGLGFGSGSGGSAFEGENLMHLMKSRKLIQTTLIKPVIFNNTEYTLLQYYLQNNEVADDSKRSKKELDTLFGKEGVKFSRQRDSILLAVINNITKNLEIQKIDKRADIITVSFKNSDEFFSKSFVEELVNNVIIYYTEYKIKKTRQNVAILQRQTDSMRSLISGNIVDIAVANDLNVNPTRQIVRTGVQRKQIDAQVNAALYTELVKNLELSKLTLRKETPLVQIIDTPMLPLEKKKMGRFIAALIFGFAGFLLTSAFFILRRVFSIANTNTTLNTST
jgi:uncharacterized protein involved in exopolysaccharide biosynthesis